MFTTASVLFFIFVSTLIRVPTSPVRALGLVGIAVTQLLGGTIQTEQVLSFVVLSH